MPARRPLPAAGEPLFRDRPVLTTPERIAPAQSRPVRWRRRGAAFPVLTLISLALGLALGLGSAWYAVDHEYPFGGVRAGAWTLWPRVGSREIDPYARAIVVRRGDLPLGVGEGIALRASRDDTGRPLDPRCTYRIGRGVPQARAWTLTVYDGQGRTDPDQGHVYSGSVLRTREGGFDVALARDAQPGNWLRLPDEGPTTLVLRLYDTPIASGSAALDRNSVPRVERMGCTP